MVQKRMAKRLEKVTKRGFFTVLIKLETSSIPYKYCFPFRNLIGFAVDILFVALLVVA